MTNANENSGLSYVLGTTTLGDISYGYDVSGNRISLGGTWGRTGLPSAMSSATYDAANQIATWNSTSFTYDDNGNLTGDGTNTYTWNARNQLTGLSGGVSASFSYDGAGRRRAKTISSTTTKFLYDGWNLVQELNSGGTPTANMIPGLAIDEIFRRTDSAGARDLLTDALGSTLALADGSGTVQTSYTYEPFGATTTTGSASTNASQFTGRENDGTGLYDYRARYYHPQLQRFISEDPLGFGGGVNLAAYAANSPAVYGDALGLKPGPRFGKPGGKGPGGKGPRRKRGPGGGSGPGGPGGDPGDGPDDDDDPPPRDPPKRDPPRCDGWYREPGDRYLLGREGSDIIAPGDPFGRFLENSFPASHAASTVHDNLVGGLTAQGWPDALVNIPTMPGTYLSEVLNQVGRSFGHPVFGPTCHP